MLVRKNSLENEIKNLLRGSIEIRDVSGKRYVYLHFRDSGKLYTKYAGEYNEGLIAQIKHNNVYFKQLKNELKETNAKMTPLMNDGNEKVLSKKVRRCVDYAKHELVSSIYKQARLEGVAVTYLDTETIIEKGKVSNLNSDDISKVTNLKHAWEFILSEDVLLSKSNYSILRAINRLVEEGFYYNAGELRNVPVTIGGTTWKPPFPIESVIIQELNEILDAPLSDVDKALKTLLFIMRKQIFIDGNKRTAVIFANHILISKGLGIVVIPEVSIGIFKKLLITYYETGSDEALLDFLTKDCLLLL